MKLDRSKFNDFRKVLSDRGWHLKRCSQDHWQVKGVFAKAVNLHWGSGNALTVYVSGAVAGMSVKSTFEAVLSYLAGAECATPKRHGRVSMTDAKRRLFNSKPHRCSWCFCELDFPAATVDHLIPLSRGGSNRIDNLCLSCDSCNRSRGNSMRPLNLHQWELHLCGGTC